MAHSRLRKQSVLARSVELERSTSGAGEMLPGAVTTQFRAGRGFATTGSEPVRYFRTSRCGQVPLRHSTPKIQMRATSARDDARPGRPLALTSHRARSDFPSGAAPDRVYRRKLARGIANKKYVWSSVGLQRAGLTARLEL